MMLPSNTTLVPKGYWPNIKKYKDYSPDFFIDKFVKKAFKEKDVTEYLWAKVIGVKENALVGKINNDPLFLDIIKYDDEVVIEMEEILTYIDSSKE